MNRFSPCSRTVGVFAACWLIATPITTFAENPASATMSFQRPEQLLAAGAPIDLGSHATTRCFDWDGDGNVDLLVGGGDGRLWWYRNVSKAETVKFAAGQPIVAGSRDRWGTGYTGVLLANLVGSALPDLVVAHSDDQVSIHENRGSIRRPQFQEQGLSVTVQKQCQGRFDVADWDGDGLLDIVTGSFGGPVIWYRNDGKRTAPHFTEGAPFHDISVAYNSHPRLVDFDQDGQLDLLLGVNWGSASLSLNEGANGSPKLSSSRQMQWADDGANLSLREFNGDDTTPELVDLDRDGALDLVSGGKNGRVWLLRGVGITSRLSTVRAALEEHGDRLPQRLSEDAVLRKQIFGALTAIQADVESGLVSTTARADLFTQLAALVKQYPTLFHRQTFDLKSSPFAPSLAAQVWVLVLESLPDSAANRERVADALQFAGGYRQLLTQFGVIFIDNNTATSEQLIAMYELMEALPRRVWDVETITVAGWLGSGFNEQKIRSRTGVNIFDLPLGRIEDSFAGDSPRPGVTDVFMICLAHELTHNMLDTVGRRLRPELYERKFAGLAQAAGPLVVYRTPQSRGIDMTATKANFKAAGHWDGSNDSWETAWKDYFKGKPEFDRGYSRGNIQFFLDAPQEAFATLANQYFADSQLMLDFCKTRWDAGHRTNINQFLLIVDYLSDNTNQVPMYVLRPGGDLTVTQAKLKRDPKNRIIEVQTPTSKATFNYDSQDLVTDLQVTRSR